MFIFLKIFNTAPIKLISRNLKSGINVSISLPISTCMDADFLTTNT